ncbi:hypothetical protein PVAP13_8NG048702 [Panicum virgatum]|uniref:Uncharacterized protein n=1 Tax=Panicum virgatum TaxID=38727 RepID=A0A8T0P1N4_PANVG|nr:hypothetical protein PVAP13_8NG048702 [Panicum virgatum]
MILARFCSPFTSPVPIRRVLRLVVADLDLLLRVALGEVLPDDGLVLVPGRLHDGCGWGDSGAENLPILGIRLRLLELFWLPGIGLERIILQEQVDVSLLHPHHLGPLLALRHRLVRRSGLQRRCLGDVDAAAAANCRRNLLHRHRIHRQPLFHPAPCPLSLSLSLSLSLTLTLDLDRNNAVAAVVLVHGRSRASHYKAQQP